MSSRNFLARTFRVLLLTAAATQYSQAQAQQSGTLLNDDTVATRTAVDQYADLSLDVRDIRAFARDNNRDEAMGLYNQGMHAQFVPGFSYPLKRLSLDLADGGNNATKTPHYLYHLFGLTDQSTSGAELTDMSRYAHNYVAEALHAHLDLAAESIVALNMWMFATHVLHDGVLKCQYRTHADSPDMIPLGGGGMDEFIALWIGAEQGVASQNGHGLYAWAQQYGQKFHPTETEAPVNSQLKLLYQEGASALSLTGACTSSNTNTVQQLYSVSTRIIRQMMIPLLQSLLYEIDQQDADRVLLYARALVPQVARCRPSLYKRLKDYMLDDEINFSRKAEMIRDVQAAYPCFGLTCADVGTYGESITCSTEEPRTIALAGYVASSDVAMLSRFDVDVLELSILSRLGFYPSAFEFAELLYMYGSNVEKKRDSENDPFELLSLHDLAVSSDRSHADPIFTQFVAYHNEKDYAHKAIIAGLQGTGKWKRSVEQRAQQIVITAAHQVIFLRVIGYLQQAVKACQDVDDRSMGFTATPNPIDQAAALLIGSLEGDQEGGSTDLDDGQFLWNLANQHAFQFDTLNDDGYAKVNSELVDKLYAAKAELTALDCKHLELLNDDIRKLMLVALSQSTLRAAEMSEDLRASDTNPSLAQGEVYALSMLPFIHQVDEVTAELVEENMIVRDGVDTVRDGIQAVADGYGYFFRNGLQIRCQYLGSTSDIKPCRYYGGSAAVSFTRGGIIVTAVALLAGLVMAMAG